MAEIAAIVLAAGKASRFRAAAGPDGPETKLVAHHAGKALVRHVAEAALAAGLSPVVVVLGHARDAVLRELDGLAVTAVDNPDYESGMASSLSVGLRGLPAEASGVVVLLGDMPLVGADLIERLVAAFAVRPDAAAVTPSFEGRRGNPVLLSAKLFPSLARLQGDAGARQVLQGRTDVVEVAVEDASSRIDVDTPDSLRRLADSSGGEDAP